MTRQFAFTWAGSFLVITSVSVIWHVLLFEQQYLNLGVFTRMDNPLYGFGLLAWVMEASAITWLYVGSRWSEMGLLGALGLSWAVNLFVAKRWYFKASGGPGCRSNVTSHVSNDRRAKHAEGEY